MNVQRVSGYADAVGMDVTGISAAINSVKLQQELSTAVMKKSLDATKQQGQAAIQLLESAAAISSEAPCATCGNHLDVTA